MANPETTQRLAVPGIHGFLWVRGRCQGHQRGICMMSPQMSPRQRREWEKYPGFSCLSAPLSRLFSAREIFSSGRSLCKTEQSKGRMSPRSMDKQDRTSPTASAFYVPQWMSHREGPTCWEDSGTHRVEHLCSKKVDSPSLLPATLTSSAAALTVIFHFIHTHF